MGLRPRPDAIYFVTDGDFDPQLADDIKVLNADPSIPIYTICLESRDAEQIMKRIASESGGTHAFAASAASK